MNNEQIRSKSYLDGWNDGCKDLKKELLREIKTRLLIAKMHHSDSTKGLLQARAIIEQMDIHP